MTLTTLESENPLLDELVKLSNKVRDKQRYLEIRQRDSNPNWEAGSTPSEAVKAVGDELDLLIAKLVTDQKLIPAPNYSFGSKLWGALKRERARRWARFEQGLWLVQKTSS